jgi:hypothetical protein
MQKLITFTLILLILMPRASASELTPLSKYIPQNDMNDSASRAYVSFRCSGIYLFIAEITRSDPKTSEQYHSASIALFRNGVENLLIKGNDVTKETLLGRDRVEQIRDIYAAKGEEHYNLTGRYAFPLMQEDMQVCGAYAEMLGG